MNAYTQSFREREAARTVASLLACNVPLLVAVDIAADAYELDFGLVLTAWGVL